MKRPALSPYKLRKLVNAAAGVLHENWRRAYVKVNGEIPRWKPLSPADGRWLAKHPLPRKLLKGRPAREINIAGCAFEQLPPSYRRENLRAARAAIESHLAHPREHLDRHAARIHDQWLARQKQPPPALAVPFARLSKVEKDKDRVVAKVARQAVTALR
jgi:hypothetical protein